MLSITQKRQFRRTFWVVKPPVQETVESVTVRHVFHRLNRISTKSDEDIFQMIVINVPSIAFGIKLMKSML